MKSRLATFIAAMTIGVASADVVYVYEQTFAGGVTTQISDRSLETGRQHSTQNAPVIKGYVFTHWTISTKQSFSSRDAWGRALDTASFTLYEETILTANYLPESLDEDGDGIADGYEMYWYGNLNQTSLSDTDGDGVLFADELTAGTNPLMAEFREEGPVLFVDGNLLQYNPYNYQPYAIRSDPDGELFSTITDYKRPGEEIKTEELQGTTFAYWTVNGVRQSDAWGRALDIVSLRMPDMAVEIVAVCEEDYETRMKLYWYGNTSVAMTSDTDGDGKTFAEELEAGTNPLMAEHHEDGSVLYVDGVLMQYNPYNLQPYVVRSEPEGVLFATTSDYVRVGMPVSVKSPGGSFAYWVLDGVPQRDAWGRAIDDMSFMMPEKGVELVAIVEEDENTRQQLYWYGNTTIPMTSDTDGDGKTFAEELATGTNPLMAEWHEEGPIVFVDTSMLEMNLQSYEQAQGTIVGNEYTELFTSIVAGNGSSSRTFDGVAKPTMVDLNGDGLSDLVVETDKGTITVFLNKGSAGNPMFIETLWREEWHSLLAAAKPASIEGLTFDVEPVGIISWTFADIDGDGNEDILMADNEGRIWYYRASADRYLLQHKVWGGSYAGFAEGLSIFATDWDDDGDVDLVCGTADGKLMLLNDPRVGRPVNVRAEAGVDSVVLSWDPNVNSRVRGYGVYRSSDSNEFEKVQNTWPLPRYRDTPDVIQDYWYRVTGKSRLYRAGNSIPIESESPPTDAVFVRFCPNVWLNDTSSFTEKNVEVIVSVDNSMGISSEGLSMAFRYDASVLEPVEVKPFGLTSDVKFVSSVSDGVWSISATGGAVKTGSGVFVKFVFFVKPVHNVVETQVSLESANMKSELGQRIILELPKTAKVLVTDSNPPVPAGVILNLSAANAETRSDFTIPVTIRSTKTLTSLRAKIEYDSSLFEFKATDAGTWNDGILIVEGSVPRTIFLTFHAKEQHIASSSRMRLCAASATCIDGLAASVTTTDCTVAIKDSNPPVPAKVSVVIPDSYVETCSEFTVPLTILSSKDLVEFSVKVGYDRNVFEFRRCEGGEWFNGTIVARDNVPKTIFLTFYAKDQHVTTESAMTLSAASAKCGDNFAASITASGATLWIKDANPLLPADVELRLADLDVQTRHDFTLPVSINSTKALEKLSFHVGYDKNLFEFKSCEGGVWSDGTVAIEGSVPKMVLLVFSAKDQHSADSSRMTLSSASAVCVDGLAANISVADCDISIEDTNVPVPVSMSASVWDARVTSGSEFELSVGVTTSGALASFCVTLEWDAELIELSKSPSSESVEILSSSSARFRFDCAGEYNTFKIAFKAAEIDGLKADVAVRMTAVSGMGSNGLAAEFSGELPMTSTVSIVREIGKYSPGDVDGDGKYTSADGIVLTGYVTYVKFMAYGKAYAESYAKQYETQCKVDIRLSGQAAKAADVNCDGKVDASDITMMEMLIAQSEGI